MSRGARAWLATSWLLATCALLSWFAPRQVLDWQPALAAAQPWRAWSAAFVHWSPWHLAANLLGCAVVGLFGVAARVAPGATVAWLVAWPLGHALLALQPALASYGGLSGVLHAGVVVAAWPLAFEATGARRAIGLAVLLGVAAKLVLEAAWIAPVQVVPEWDFPVASLAHLTGAAAGLACALVAQRGRRGRPA